jgi:glycosyltransferase involved in cell wall biosynthesis
MRIGIDARFLTHPQPGGFKTYTENLIMGLSQVDSENKYILYIDRPPVDTDLIPGTSNCETRIVVGDLPTLGMPWREQVQLTRQVAADRIDLFHSPCMTAPLSLRCPLVVTVHDMIWAFPKQFSQTTATRSIKRNFMGMYNYFVPSLAAKRAVAIITVSHAARETILKYMKCPPEKVDVTWEAARSSFMKINDDQCLENVRRKFGLSTRYILGIGSADPRKNIQSLVKAYSLLSDELKNEYHLAIVWTHPRFAEEMSKQITALGVLDKIHFMQNVSNEDLVYLYNSASLFVFPSLYEGFGLPILESMSCGTPVAAANNSSIPEISGDAAILFDAKDTQELSQVITQVLTDENVRTTLIQKGLERSATFSWEKCARETLSVYKKVLSS